MRNQAKRYYIGPPNSKDIKACTVKSWYKSKAKARHYLRLKGYQGKPYKCPSCTGWHITTKG